MQFDLGDVEYLPVRRRELRRRALELRSDLRARSRERRGGARARHAPGRAARLHAPGSRTRSSASSTGDSPRSRSRAARPTSGAARTTSRTCSADDFEIEFEDGTLWLEADSGEEIWKLFSESAPPVLALLATLDAASARSSTARSSSSTRATAPRAARSARRAGTCSSLGRRQVSDVSRAAAAADPRRHDEPARQRDGRGGGAARLPRGSGRRVRAVREACRSARTSSPASAGRGDGPSLALLSHTDVVLADAARVAARPVRRRARRRRSMGARRARHEGRGRCERGRARDARARRLARLAAT